MHLHSVMPMAVGAVALTAAVAVVPIGETTVFDEAISRSFTVLNQTDSKPVFDEAISRSFTVLNTAGSVPIFDEAISRAFTVCNAAGADPQECDCDVDGVLDGQDVCRCAVAPGGVDAQGRPLGDFDADCDVDLEDFRIFQVNFDSGGPSGSGGEP